MTDRPDVHTLVERKVDWPKCDLTDFAKLDIRGGTIHFRLYQQDGTMQEMAWPDTYQNRLYVSWIQIHDRHTVTSEEPPP